MSKTKRVYSREFPRPHRQATKKTSATKKVRATITADHVPPDLKAHVMRKCKHDRVSLRTVILRHLAEWSEWEGWTPPSSPAAGNAATR